MRFTALFSIVTLFASFHTTLANTPTIEELIESNGVATGPSEYNEEGYRILAALKEAANIPTPTAPEVRSEDGIIGRTGEWFATQGSFAKEAHRDPSESLARDAQASPGPSLTISGRLALYEASGNRYGYAKSTLLTGGRLATTTDVSQALQVSVGFDSLQSNPSQIQITMLASTRTFLFEESLTSPLEFQCGWLPAAYPSTL